MTPLETAAFNVLEALKALFGPQFHISVELAE
jgi:hypothetical protein